MKVWIFKLILAINLINISISAFSQESNGQNNNRNLVVDSLRSSGAILNEVRVKPEIVLTKDQSLSYLQKKIHTQFWHNANDPLRQAFAQLVFEAEHQPVDSLENMLMKYPYDSLSVPWDKFYIWEPMRLKIPVIPPAQFVSPADTAHITDAGISANPDSLNILSRNITGQVLKLNPQASLKDTSIMVVIDTLKEVSPKYSRSPIKYFTHPFQSDSIKVAVATLINYLTERDSTVINMTGAGNAVTQIMMNSKSKTEIRYWLQNEFSDSVTVWIGNPGRNTIRLSLEQGVAFRRPSIQRNYANARVNSVPVDKTTLQDIKNIRLKTQYWKYKSEASFVLNQASLTNWVKGGESSISTALDVTGYADYNNKAKKISSSNFARIKFGYLKADGERIRKNIDLLETNSKLNHKAFGKFDFSAIMLFKTQIAIGKNYFPGGAKDLSDSSHIVSKFMNPAVLTIGFGLDFKPNKTTSINLSPLSYKGTFVTDPAYIKNTYYDDRIDQTLYGIEKNKKSLNEPGASFMITNEFKPIETITLVNRLQLFTNYLHNPQNVDVDWEMIATARINWFTDVRLNTHLVFDDDTKTNSKDKKTGLIKKTARIQFKELLGFSLSFRF
jgi:hypothetical protein